MSAALLRSAETWPDDVPSADDRDAKVFALRTLRTCDDAVLLVTGCIIGVYGLLGGVLAFDHGSTAGGRAGPADPGAAGTLAIAFAVTTAMILCSIALRLKIRSWIDDALRDLTPYGRDSASDAAALEVTP